MHRKVQSDREKERKSCIICLKSTSVQLVDDFVSMLHAPRRFEFHCTHTHTQVIFFGASRLNFSFSRIFISTISLHSASLIPTSTTIATTTTSTDEMMAMPLKNQILCWLLENENENATNTNAWWNLHNVGVLESGKTNDKRQRQLYRFHVSFERKLDSTNEFLFSTVFFSYFFSLFFQLSLHSFSLFLLLLLLLLEVCLFETE